MFGSSIVFLRASVTRGEEQEGKLRDLASLILWYSTVLDFAARNVVHAQTKLREDTGFVSTTKPLMGNSRDGIVARFARTHLG